MNNATVYTVIAAIALFVGLLILSRKYGGPAFFVGELWMKLRYWRYRRPRVQPHMSGILLLGNAKGFLLKGSRNIGFVCGHAHPVAGMLVGIPLPDGSWETRAIVDVVRVLIDPKEVPPGLNADAMSRDIAAIRVAEDFPDTCVGYPISHTVSDGEYVTVIYKTGEGAVCRVRRRQACLQLRASPKSPWYGDSGGVWLVERNGHLEAVSHSTFAGGWGPSYPQVRADMAVAVAKLAERQGR